jgi:putative MATE family efflux protein
MLHGIIVIDAYLVSRLGEPALSALGLAGSISAVLLGILFAFSNATQIRIAQAFGSKESVALKTGFYVGLLINLVATGLGLLVVWIVSDDIISSFAHSSWIADQAKRYLDIFMIVVVSEAIGQCLSSHFNGCGKTKVPFHSYLIALPLNVGASIVLIHGYFGLPELGLTGAALGSALGSFARVVFLSFQFYRIDHAFTGVAGWLHGAFSTALRRHLVFSLPIAGTFVSMTLANSACVLIYAKLSVNEFAAITLIIPWVHIVGMIGMSWSQSTGIILAQLLGGNHSGEELDIFLSRAWRMAFAAAGIVSMIYLSICLASGWLYKDLQPETKDVLFSFLPILLLLPFPKGSNAICGNTLRAGGDTVYVMNIFAGSSWLFKVPFTALFVMYLELPIFWVFSLFLFDELVKFSPFHLRLYKGVWKSNLNTR